jgi:hypothetical protein
MDVELCGVPIHSVQVQESSLFQEAFAISCAKHLAFERLTNTSSYLYVRLDSWYEERADPHDQLLSNVLSGVQIQLG